MQKIINNNVLNISILFVLFLFQINFINVSGKAISYTESIGIPEDHPDNKQELAEYLNNTGYQYWNNGELKKAIEYFQKSIHINKEIGNENAVSSLLNFIGLIYSDLGNYDSAIFYIEKSLAYSNKGSNKDEICDKLINLSIAYQNKNNYTKSNEFIEKALAIAQELNNVNRLKNCYSILAENYEKLGEPQKSFDYFNLAASLSKHIQEKQIKEYETRTRQAEQAKSVKEKELESTTNTLKKEKEKIKEISVQVELLNKEKELQDLALKEKEAQNLALAAKDKMRRMINYFLGFGMALTLIFFSLIFYQFRTKKRANRLLEQQNAQIQQQKEEIEQQRDVANGQKQKITSSINYAKHIQSAVLPPEHFIKKILPEHFILFKPKDIVSGDFYWITEKEGVIILAVADCTGHGVPGGFMSMLGIAYLNEIVNKIVINKHIRSLHANEILNQLRDQVIHSLHQSYEVEKLKDGMDIALIIIDVENRYLQFAGAHNPLYIIRNNELKMLKPDKMPIGIYKSLNISFTNHEFELEFGDNLYLFTDGYYDQLDESNTQKFLIKNFRQLLLKHSNKPMAEQKDILEEAINKWKGEREQLDDMLVFGLKIVKYVKPYVKDKTRNWETKRILIAEDTDLNYFLLVEALKSSHAQIFRAKNGLEAVEFCKNNEVDLVLMDINMPILNGLDATRQIREFKKNLPVIAQTAQSQPTDIIDCKEAGCNDYIAKPIDLRSFLNKIEKLI